MKDTTSRRFTQWRAKISRNRTLEHQGKVMAGRFEHLLRLANDAILLFDDQGRILEANERAAEYYGRSLEELRALPLENLRPQAGAVEARAQFEDLKRLGTLRFESVHCRKNGTSFPVQVSSRLVEIDGEAVAFSIIQDITERRAQEKDMRRLTNLYAALSQVNQAIVWSSTREELLPKICEVLATFGRFKMVWIGWKEAGGPNVEVLASHGDTGGYLKDFTVRYDEAPQGLGPVGRAIRENRHIVCNDFLECKDGEPWREAAAGSGFGAMAAFPIHQSGEVCGALAVYNRPQDTFGEKEVLLLVEAALDVSFALDHLAGEEQRAQAQAEHQELTAQLYQAQKMESLGSLAGGIAHDINNVLAAILSLASVHRENLDASEPLAKSLDTISRACLRGRDVVKSLLYFARKELATVGPVDLNALVQDLAGLLTRTTLKRVRLETELLDALGPIRGDAGTLSHAVMNLCVNAVDAMPQGGVLRLGTRRLPDGQIQLSVKDTGEGMSAEVRERAMEPFFTTKPMGKGTGLGLSMVFGTMKAHGGSVEIFSEPGSGTEVILRFPAFVESGAPMPIPGAFPREETAQKKLRILLVDDDELIRQAVAPMLEILGHRVWSVEGGQEALRLVKEGLAVDLVVLDMNMPGMDGAETLQRLLEIHPDQTVLMASGYNDHDMNALMAGHPRISTIQKPFNLQEIKAKLVSLASQT